MPDSIGESALIDRIDDLRPRDLIGIAGVNARFSWLVRGPLSGSICNEAAVRALRYARQHRHFVAPQSQDFDTVPGNRDRMLELGR